MSKRFTDTNKYRKLFFRNLSGSYKLLWDYLYHACDHAGIWHCDEEIAQVYIGKDMPIKLSTALELFNAGEERIKVLNGGSKWFIIPFIEFQYDCTIKELNPANRAHKSVIKILIKHGIIDKPLESPSQGAMVGVKDKDKDKDKDKEDSKSKKEGNKKIKTEMPENFGISDRVRRWAEEKGHTHLEEHLEGFKQAVSSHGYKYIDWDSAFQTAIRKNWAEIKGDNGNGLQTGGSRRQSGSRDFVQEAEEQQRERYARVFGRGAVNAGSIDGAEIKRDGDENMVSKVVNVLKRKTP